MNYKLREALAIVEKYGMKGDVIYKEIEALAASKPAPQAQAGEPEVHVTMDDAIAAGDGTLHGAIEYWQNQCAKKDAALDACALPESYTGGTCLSYPGRRAEVTLHFSSIEDADRWFAAITSKKDTP